MKQICTCFLIFYSLLSYSQSYENLVFEGGGIRGIAYVGVVQELNKHGVMDSIKKVGGTSAGAIVALTVSLGYTADEIQHILEATSFNEFNDGKYFFFGGIHRLKKHYGWYRGKKFDQWVENILKTKTGNVDITFAELHQKGFRDLYVTGTCLNKQKTLVFSHETYPNMKVKDAVRISMSIPLYFEAVFIDNEGATYYKPKNTQNLDLVIDGGVTGNFPIFLFDSTSKTNPQQRIPNFKTLGIRIDSDTQIVFDQNKRGLAPMEVRDFKSYMGAFYNYINENINRCSLNEGDWKRTISVSSSNISQRIRKMPTTEINTLVQNGRTAVQAFFQKSR